MTTETEELAIDIAEDFIEDVIDTVEVVRNNPTLLVVCAGLGVIAGATGGYFFAKKRLEEKYAAIADHEINEGRLYYQNMHKVDENGPLTPDALLEKLHGPEALAALREKQGLAEGEELSLVLEEIEESEESEESVVLLKKEHVQRLERNLFETNAEGIREFDWDTESPLRGDTDPYIITFEEFNANEHGFEQLQMTYWETDDVLADSQEQIVPDADAAVGEDHLVDRWGYGSQDKNTIYVRNPSREIEMEIVRSPGSYTKEVMGFDDEPSLKHSDRGIRKFRGHHE